jgi:hypothetical protein
VACPVCSSGLLPGMATFGYTPRRKRAASSTAARLSCPGLCAMTGPLAALWIVALLHAAAALGMMLMLLTEPVLG